MRFPEVTECAEQGQQAGGGKPRQAGPGAIRTAFADLLPEHTAVLRLL
ncbi:hypothetical protein [Streptomyces sp. V4I2]|nr:hypothetical protein [Streptomyces sp. V4I2]MDQ1041977.1 hypothetical protein [Streptomyces sp. V4I2]